MIEAVLDTNVLVAGLRSDHGAAHALLREIGLGWRPVISTALALEYEDVLHRPRLVPHLDTAALDEFLDYLFRAARLVPRVTRRRPLLPDAGDEHILELALELNVMIVTHNVAHFRPASQLGVAVVRPSQMIRRVRGLE